MVRINGKALNIAGITIASYLQEAGYDVKRIAVERNGNILPRSKYNETVINEGDIVEIVSFVGGG